MKKKKTCVEKDKILHFMVSMAIAILVVLLCLPLGTIAAVGITVCVCSIAGIGKEIYDCKKDNPTGFDWKDLLADLIGMIVGITLIFIL